MKNFCIALCALALTISPVATIPSATGTALDGHTVTLPRDLSRGATILILGFTKDSQQPTTMWQKAIGNSLAGTNITYFDMPFLEDAPGMIRPLIVRGIRKQVPGTIRPNFVPLTSGQAAWKQAAGFNPATPDAAYVLLVDNTGTIRWQTREPYSQALFDELSRGAAKLAAR